jgi:hypothetical protein
MITWSCQKCGKALSLQKTGKNGFWISVFENEDGSPRSLRDDTQARIMTLDNPNDELPAKIICWDCHQKSMISHE